MIALGGGATKIHLATDPVDLRRGYSGLYTLIESQFGGEPMQGHLWVFFNRIHYLMKVFFRDERGMVILEKRLHEGSFKAWPQRGQKIVILTPAELQLLLSGLDVAKLRPRRWVRHPLNETAQEPGTTLAPVE